MKVKTNQLAKACLLSAGLIGAMGIQSASAEALKWNGFFTGAFSQSDSEYGYGRFYEISDSGSYLTDTRLGLQATAKVNDKVSLTTQLVAKNNNENFEVNANWLFANIALTSDSSMKLGRMQQPIYLFSSQLEAGYTIPWVRPPQEVYEQQFFNDYTGLELGFKKYIAGHDVSLKVLHGVQDNEIRAAVLGTVFAREEPLIEYMSSDDFLGLSVQIEGDFYRFNIAGVKQGLDVGIPADVTNTFSLGLGDCMASGGPQQHTPAQCSQLFSTVVLLGGEGGLSLDGDFWTAGVDMHFSDLRLIAEYALRKVGDFDREGYYVSVMYRADKVTPYLTYATHDTRGVTIIDPQTQNSIAFGARYEWQPNTALKFEILSVDPQDGTRGLYHVGFVPDEMESMNAVTLALDLVF